MGNARITCILLSRRMCESKDAGINSHPAHTTQAAEELCCKSARSLLFHSNSWYSLGGFGCLTTHNTSENKMSSIKALCLQVTITNAEPFFSNPEANTVYLAICTVQQEYPYFQQLWIKTDYFLITWSLLIRVPSTLLMPEVLRGTWNP